jgi:hypothetical protein
MLQYEWSGHGSCILVLLTPDYSAAFISVLHLYETFGWWRRADYIKVHFAESMNEFHHLLIMEVCSQTFCVPVHSMPCQNELCC